MKYQVGDLILVKNINLRPRPGLHSHLNNTYGIITAVEKHTDIFGKDSTEKDNKYIWFSQVDQKEYYLYEDELEGEVVK